MIIEVAILIGVLTVIVCSPGRAGAAQPREQVSVGWALFGILAAIFGAFCLLGGPLAIAGSRGARGRRR